MKTIEGDLIKLGKSGMFDVITHGCNCYCTMGSGIAKQIKQIFPRAYEEDCKTIVGDRKKLGTLSFVKIKDLWIVNSYTQYGYGGSVINTDYNALRKCFKEVKALFTGLRIGYPKIGAGLGGGNWNLISRIIEEELLGENHTLVIYTG
jgi:O-acetyl-ADP-ribose deacetylase (regulator of RNase III)